MEHPSLQQLSHRPWPLPAGRWTWRQSWCDLLFAHWPVPAGDLRPLVPPELEIDEHGGTSWVGLVPFRMEGVMRRPLPDLPWVSAFPEMNLRLYVSLGRKPGVWFISLDATNTLAVWAARQFFHLPYFRAAIDIDYEGERVHYRARRRDGSVALTAAYGPTSDAYRAEPGTLEHFLTERYCLYAQKRSGELLRVEVHHEPWPLHRADAKIEENTVLSGQGIAVEGPPALLHFSRSLDVLVWPPEAV